MNIQIAGVDIDKVTDLYEDDTDLFVTVARSYVSSIPSILDKIANVSAETLADYAISVHSIK